MYDLKHNRKVKISRQLLVPHLRLPSFVRRKDLQYNLKLAGSCSIFDWHQSLCVQSSDNSAGFTKKAFDTLRVSGRGFLIPPASGWYAEAERLDQTAYLWDLSCPFKPEKISLEMECQMTQRRPGRLQQRQTDKEN